jgi:hypothetical protein
MSEHTRPVEPEPEEPNGAGSTEMPPEELVSEDSEFMPEHGPNFPGTTDPNAG